MKEAKKLKSKAEAMVSLGFMSLVKLGSPFCHVPHHDVYGWGSRWEDHVTVGSGVGAAGQCNVSRIIRSS